MRKRKDEKKEGGEITSCARAKSGRLVSRPGTEA